MTEHVYSTTIQTPLGPMVAVATDTGLCGLEFDLPERASMLETRLRRWYELRDTPRNAPHPTLDATAAWLGAYFGGAPCPALPPLDARGTDFERAVWHALLDIPVGRTETYGNLARRLNRPNGARAVGLGVGRNPLGIMVPCHRVIGADGSLTGFGGGLERKRWLLEHETSTIQKTEDPLL